MLTNYNQELIKQPISSFPLGMFLLILLMLNTEKTYQKTFLFVCLFSIYFEWASKDF